MKSHFLSLEKIINMETNPPLRPRRTHKASPFINSKSIRISSNKFVSGKKDLISDIKKIITLEPNHDIDYYLKQIQEEKFELNLLEKKRHDQLIIDPGYTPDNCLWCKNYWIKHYGVIKSKCFCPMKDIPEMCKKIKLKIEKLNEIIQSKSKNIKNQSEQIDDFFL